MQHKKIIGGMLAGILCLFPHSLHSYAANVIGDCNGDGEVNATDASLILQDSAVYGSNGTHILPEETLALCDVDGDGQAGAVDASIILLYSAVCGTDSSAPKSVADFWESRKDIVPELKKPVIKVTTRNLAAGISWKADASAAGYEIYRSSSSASGFEKIAVVSGTNTYMDPYSDNTFYSPMYYKIRSFRETENGTEYSDFSNTGVYGTNDSILLCCDLKEREGFMVYNRQCSEAETTGYMYHLSDRDREILRKFEKEHLSDCKTNNEKLEATLLWIHYNVTYASGSDAWNAISGLSYTEAIFEKQIGQCAQYNGAMASMMAYLGYDVSLVQGYRGNYPGSYWQHFWVEIELGDRLYIMECGNEGSDGAWWYYLTPYEQTRRFVRNLINM